MFTGLIETTGTVSGVTKGRECWTVRVSADGAFVKSLKNGESVCVSGACLTVTALSGSGFDAQMMEETRDVCTPFRTGRRVNLERALMMGGRLDGHMVQGHVEGRGELVSVTGDRYSFRVGDELLMPFIVPKGSIAADGVSLTVIGTDGDRFTVGIIPTTARDTTLNGLKKGDAVNIETDILGRYIHNLIKPYGSASALSWEKLEAYGWQNGEGKR